MVTTSVTSAESPARWAKALERARSGVTLYRDEYGHFFATSQRDPNTLYRCGAWNCGCEAAASGDPICAHRAAVRSALGMFEPAAAPAAQPAEPVCPTCRGDGTFRTYYGDHLSDYVTHVCHCQRVHVAAWPSCPRRH